MPSLFRQAIQHTFKKYYLMSIAAFLLIPVVTKLGGRMFSLLNPDIALHSRHYVTYSTILNMMRHISMFSSFSVIVGLWFLTCFFLIKSKSQPRVWTVLGVIGPIGFIIMTTLRDRAPAIGDYYQRFLAWLKIYLRVPYELGFFYAVWEGTYDAIVFKRDLMISYQSATTGVPVEKIIEEQAASSGMWAFGEGLEEMYLTVLIYLLWPVLFNALAHLPRLWASARQA